MPTREPSKHSTYLSKSPAYQFITFQERLARKKPKSVSIDCPSSFGVFSRFLSDSVFTTVMNRSTVDVINVVAFLDFLRYHPSLSATLKRPYYEIATFYQNELVMNLTGEFKLNQ